ncbi:MAG: adenylate kinase [Bacteroidetes bacterium]|nr:adenylate kinase [Bacteroidota bacterium]
MRVVMLGAPGSGKGTQAKLLQASHKIPQLSTGDLLREAVHEDRELGRKAHEYMADGRLVPDELVIELILVRMQEPDCGKGFILDGFPRTLGQARALRDAFEDIGKPITHVIEIKVDQERLVERLVGRRICPNGHGEWHIKFNPPLEQGRCDKCGETLVHREDDYEEQIVTRLEAYHRDTEPLVDFYIGRKKLWTVDGNGEMEGVARQIEAVFSV